VCELVVIHVVTRTSGPVQCSYLSATAIPYSGCTGALITVFP
jgi:hypothetical protein